MKVKIFCCVYLLLFGFEIGFEIIAQVGFEFLVLLSAGVIGLYPTFVI